MSKQVHNLQDQLIAERSFNQKLNEQIESLKIEVSKSSNQMMVKLEEFEKKKEALRQPLMDLENKYTKLEAHQNVLESNQKGLGSAIENNGLVLQNKITEQSSTGKDDLNRVVLEIQKLQQEFQQVKNDFHGDRERQATDKQGLDQSIKEILPQIAALKLEIENNQAVTQAKMHLFFERMSDESSKKYSNLQRSHQTEQKTVLSVIKTMTSNLTSIRKEMQRYEERYKLCLEELKSTMLSQMKKEVKTVSRPLVLI